LEGINWNTPAFPLAAGNFDEVQPRQPPSDTLQPLFYLSGSVFHFLDGVEKNTIRYQEIPIAATVPVGIRWRCQGISREPGTISPLPQHPAADEKRDTRRDCTDRDESNSPESIKPNLL